MIDSLLLSVAAMGLSVLELTLGLPGGLPTPVHWDADFWSRLDPERFQALYWLTYSALAYVTFVWGQALTGTTVGKRLLRLWVARAPENANARPSERMSIWEAHLRGAGYLVCGVTFGLGYLRVLWHPRRQGLHDWMAGTVVIRAHGYTKSK